MGLLQSLTQMLVQIAQPAWTIVFALLAQMFVLRRLRTLGERFKGVTGGHLPFDLQNGLTVAAMNTQLPDYTADSKALYRHFFTLDFFFPFFASCFLALLWALILQRPGTEFESLMAAALPVWAFLPALFDWGENVCFLLIIQRYPQRMPPLEYLAILSKRLKLLTLGGAGIVTVLLLVLLLVSIVFPS